MNWRQVTAAVVVAAGLAWVPGTLAAAPEGGQTPGSPGLSPPMLPVDFVPGRRSLVQFLPFLDSASLQRAGVGLALFNTDFEPYLPDAPRRSGLGPLYNSGSCEGCHNNLGRGRMPDRSGPAPPALVVQLSMLDAHGRVVGDDPVYGPNINPLAVSGVPVEAAVEIEWATLRGNYPDGDAYELRRPLVRLQQLGYGPLDPRTAASARLAPPIIGVALVEAIPEAAILGAADPVDRDGDGVQGRPNWVVDASGGRQLGRFGWKANQPSVRAQTSAAAHAEMGMTTRALATPNCTVSQRECLAAATVTRQPELTDADLEALVLFQRSVAVPARRPLQTPSERMGADLFSVVGCANCHRPGFKVADVPGMPQLRGTTIQPFSDLLLHDMGEDLADGRPDHEASGRDWRTPPLWGLGLTRAVGGSVNLLHDGRARSVEEAILWHGGEAARAKAAYVHLGREQRAALAAFLDTL